jgi:hypothetical protein
MKFWSGKYERSEVTPPPSIANREQEEGLKLLIKNAFQQREHLD